jgi:hypothetical protein
MSNTIKRLTIGLAAVATMALAAPSTSAQVEVTDELGNHCSEVTKIGTSVSGGCEFHLVNEGEHVEYVQHPVGGGPSVLLYDCDYEFGIHIGEDGEGWIDDVNIPDGETLWCPTLIIECRSGGDEPWHFDVEEVAEDLDHANIEACLRVQPTFGGPDSFNLTGHLEFALGTSEGLLQSAEAEDTRLEEQFPSPEMLGSQLEFNGHWHVTGESVIINHIAGA